MEKAINRVIDQDSVATKAVAVKRVAAEAVDEKMMMSEALANMNRTQAEQETLKRISKNVKKIREAQGLSQEFVAESAGFHRTFVSKVERCTSFLNVGNLTRLAVALNVDVSELLKP
jgi:ribosome-binding protein aMBF1 (putative translation factor)